MAEVPLADAITNLRLELQRAMAAAEGSPLRFEIDSVVLELEVALSTSGSADAKVGLWNVVSVGGGAARTQGSTHRLTLSLSPRLAGAEDGERVQVGDDLHGLPPVSDGTASLGEFGRLAAD